MHCTLWERACSQMRCISHHLSRLTHRFREQARSHRGNVWSQGELTTQQSCHRHGARSGCASGDRPPRVR
ncbi:hypothetical protein E3W21_08705 [Pseudomonas sp. F01002]|nr:hypothetical protein E3W21_08705 [Pseudomonas sp. F01002]